MKERHDRVCVMLATVGIVRVGLAGRVMSLDSREPCVPLPHRLQSEEPPLHGPEAAPGLCSSVPDAARLPMLSSRDNTIRENSWVEGHLSLADLNFGV